MRILVWNCRGLGHPRTVQELIRLVRMHCPNVVFISEVRQQKFFMENIGWRIGFRNCYPVPVKGKGGGLALYWDDSVTVDLASFSIHDIDVKINEQFGMKWRYTFVYGEPKVEDRKHMWTLLKRI